MGGFQRKFRFEAMWLKHDEFKEKCKQIWENANSESRGLNEVLKNTADGLSEWSSAEFGSIKRQLKRLEWKLARLRRRRPTRSNTQEKRRVEEEMAEILRREEVMWRQRSRVAWLQEGDRNTRFFHQRANEQRKNNRIARLHDEQGREIMEQEELEVHARHFFVDLFRTEGVKNMAPVLRLVPRKVTQCMNEKLAAGFTKEEVKKALFQMGAWKAPGPDGYPAGFYQKNWELVHEKLEEGTLKFLNGGVLEEGVNETVLVLIPKVKHPENLSQFQPISLCNVTYKLIAKVLANRLKEILPDIISEEQSAFVAGRLISDNILTAYECIHTIKRRRKGRRALSAVKLDMSKAYDRVEWHFLREIMLKLGFSENWVGLIMKCVTSPSFSVLVNGNRSE